MNFDVKDFGWKWRVRRLYGASTNWIFDFIFLFYRKKHYQQLHWKKSGGDGFNFCVNCHRAYTTPGYKLAVWTSEIVHYSSDVLLLNNQLGNKINFQICHTIRFPTIYNLITSVCRKELCVWFVCAKSKNYDDAQWTSTLHKIANAILCLPSHHKCTVNLLFFNILFS